jgi:serine/threonine protein kinase
MDLRVADTVFGATEQDKYTIVRLIDSGGFGTVYEISDRNDNRFALKTILTALLDDTKLRANVTRVFYFHDGRQHAELPPYMIMEYAEGGTLKDWLAERKNVSQFIPSNELRQMFVELASGMQAINSKLVHRDVKPDNILLVNDKLKISDFGLSKVVGAATRSETFKGINHVMYCAPEAWRQEENLPSMDMYSMGITFYELATLQHPYTVVTTGDFVDAWKTAHFTQPARDPRQINQHLDPQLAQIILKMISKRSSDRYQSWELVLERLNVQELDRRISANVSRLVEAASKIHQRSESHRLKMEAQNKLRQERRELLCFSFKEISDVAEEIVASFNANSEFVKLEIRKQSLGFSIFSSQGVGALPTVRCGANVSEDNITISQWELIRGWGLIKAPSGRGFNLLLVASGNEDIYGRWQALKVTHNPILASRDDRPEPFGLELDELQNKIHSLNAIDVYQYERRPFEGEMLLTLVEELLHN